MHYVRGRGADGSRGFQSRAEGTEDLLPPLVRSTVGRTGTGSVEQYR